MFRGYFYFSVIFKDEISVEREQYLPDINSKLIIIVWSICVSSEKLSFWTIRQPESCEQTELSATHQNIEVQKEYEIRYELKIYHYTLLF